MNYARTFLAYAEGFVFSAYAEMYGYSMLWRDLSRPFASKTART